MAASAQIQKINWWHERLADTMLAHPEKTLKDIAALMGCTPAWLSTVKNSDTFIDYWRQRSTAHSEQVTGDIKAKGFAAAELALDHLHQKLSDPAGELLPTETLLNIVDITMKRFGYSNEKAPQAPVFNFNLGNVTPEQLANAREKLRRADSNEQVTELKALPAPTSEEEKK